MDYDDTSRFLFTQYPASFTRWLIGGNAAFSAFSPTELNLSPVRGDGIILLKNPHTIAHIEFQTQAHRQMPYRMANYYIRLKSVYPQLPIRQVVVYLHKTKSKKVFQNVYETPEMNHRFQIIRLWEEDPAIFFELPGLLPYAVLAKTPNSTATLIKVAQAIDSIPDQQQRSELTAAVGIFAALKLETTIINSILHSEIMEQSVIYRQIIQKGREEGREAGREEGLVHERSLIIRLLNRRIGQVPTGLEQQLMSLSAPQLADLGEALLDFTTIDDLSTWLAT